MGLCRLLAAAGNDLSAAPRFCHGSANQAVVLFESDARISSETSRVRMKGAQKVFNLPADLRILRSPPFSRSN
jgi:hypothetical protein